MFEFHVENVYKLIMYLVYVFLSTMACVLCLPALSHVENVPNYTFFVHNGTVGTKIIADPEKWFHELISENLLNLLRDRPWLELIIVASNFQALLFLQDKLLESIENSWIPVKRS